MGAAIALVVAVVLILIGVPIAFSFAGMLLVLTAIYQVNISSLMTTGYWSIGTIILVALPLFIMMGYLMQSGGIAKRLINWVESIMGRVRGGLGATLVVTCGVFGAISGTSTAAIAALGTLMLPAMYESGYPRGFTAALLTISSVLGLLIPPSITMILYAFVTKQSVAACFLSTVGPGILLIIINIIINTMVCSRTPAIKVQPPITLAAQVKKVRYNTFYAFPALLMPLIILGGIYGGVFTPTEAAAVAVLYSIPLGFLIYRGLTLSSFSRALISAATSTGVIMIILLFSMVAGRIFTVEKIPQELTSLLLSISDNKYIILLMVNALLIFAGMIMDDVTVTVIIAPMLLPLLVTIGINPIHFGAIVGTSVVIGGNSPPVAPMLYFTSYIAKVKIEEMIKPALMLMAFSAFPVMLVTTYWPALSLFLPRLFGYIN